MALRSWGRRCAPVAVAVAVLLAGGAPAQAGPGNDPFLAVGITMANGSGCLKDAIKIHIHPDLGGFDLSLGDRMLAQYGPHSAGTDIRRNCLVGVQVAVEDGTSYAVSEHVERGFASLTSGVTALSRSTFYYAGSPTRPSLQGTLTGPYSNDWTFSEQVPEEQAIWSPCHQSPVMTHTSELRINAGARPREDNYLFGGVQATPPSPGWPGTPEIPEVTYRLRKKPCD